MNDKIKLFILCISGLIVGWFILAFAIAFIVYVGWRCMATEAVAVYMAYSLLHSLISINGMISIAVLVIAYLIILLIES